MKNSLFFSLLAGNSDAETGSIATASATNKFNDVLSGGETEIGAPPQPPPQLLDCPVQPSRRVCLASSQAKPDWQTVGIDHRVNLAAQTTS